jgi:hypothetical protein
LSDDEPQNAIRYDAGKAMPIAHRRHKILIKAKTSLGKPYDPALGNPTPSVETIGVVNTGTGEP